MSDWAIIGTGLYAVCAILTWGAVRVNCEPQKDVSPWVVAAEGLITKCWVSACWPYYWGKAFVYAMSMEGDEE